MDKTVLEQQENKEFIETMLRVERDKLNQVILDNNLNMSCTEVILQSTVVDELLNKLRVFDEL